MIEQDVAKAASGDACVAVTNQGVVQAYPELPPNTSSTPQQAALITLPTPAAFFPLSGLYARL